MENTIFGKTVNYIVDVFKEEQNITVASVRQGIVVDADSDLKGTRRYYVWLMGNHGNSLDTVYAHQITKIYI